MSRRLISTALLGVLSSILPICSAVHPYRAAAQSTPTVRTPTATPVPVGCCQVNRTKRTTYPICGNVISKLDCLNDFANQGTFCETCSCTSHSGPGFEFSAGVCASNPTRTPTSTPTSTPTPTAASGCCQINSSRPGPRPFICGNQIDRESCLQNYGSDASYCRDCVCSSHSGAGFTFAPGTCLSRGGGSTRPRPPRPTRPPRPQLQR